MAPNPLDERVDPNDPATLIRWTARAAAAFETIQEDVREIKVTQAASSEWRVQTEARLATGAQTFREHAGAIGDLRGQLSGLVRDLPDMVGKAIANALPKPAGNPAPAGDRATVTFKWLLEKVAMPLLMSGVGAGITIVVAKAAGAFGP